MRRPRGKRLCAHLTPVTSSAGHCWRIDRTTDLLLCDACHESFGSGGSVRVDSILSLEPEPAKQYRNPPASASFVLEQRQLPKLSAEDRESLRIAMDVSRLAQKLALPGHDWRLTEESRRCRQLKARIERHPDRACPKLKGAAEQLEWVRKRLVWTRLALREFKNLVRRAERLLALALARPGEAFRYRRRAYRKLKRGLDQIAMLLDSLTVPPSHHGEYLARGRAAFEGLAYRFGGPLTDAQIAAVLAKMPCFGPEEVQACLSCECPYCKAGREGRFLTPSQEAETLPSCPCAFCRWARHGIHHMPAKVLAGSPLLAVRMRNAN
jgi:hypothetical protein